MRDALQVTLFSRATSVVIGAPTASNNRSIHYYIARRKAKWSKEAVPH